MDNNIYDLVYYCRINNLSQKSVNENVDYELVYKYIIDKFMFIEDLESYNMFEYLQKPNTFLQNISLLEKYKRRKLKPIQFAKEKEQNLKERLEKHLESIKLAKADGDKEREMNLKIEIEEIKNLIQAHKEKIKRIKLDR